jgi:hypothetical protein
MAFWCVALVPIWGITTCNALNLFFFQHPFGLRFAYHSHKNDAFNGIKGGWQ